MLKIRPINFLQIYISEVKDGSVVGPKQSKDLLSKHHCTTPVVYFHHLHQARRFYLNSDTSLSSQYNNQKINADAIITNQNNVCLAMNVADCFPVLIADPNKKIFALIHAGWKPLLQNIIELTILDLKHLYRCNPEELIIWVGPGIKKCCYLSKEKPIQAELETWRSAIKKNKKHWQINLPLFIKNETKRLGIKQQNIYDLNVCTCCNPDQFFSHYRSIKNKKKLDDGRMLIAVEREK